MSEYNAKSNNALSFEVTKDEKLIGKLSYNSWFKFNAVIDLADYSHYVIEPKGFWGTTIELKYHDRVLLKFRMNWNGEIVIQTHFNDCKKSYAFKHRGIFKESFVLVDEEGSEYVVMKPNFKWNNPDYEYQIATSEAFEEIPDKEIILITSLHCANYYMSMMSSASVI